MNLETNVTASAQQESAPAPAAEVNTNTSTPSASESATSNSAPESAPASSSNESQEIASVSASDGKGKYVLYTDESGQRRLKLSSEEPTPAETEVEEQQTQEDSTAQGDTNSAAATAQNVANELQQPSAPYTLGEFTQALTTGNVDESRIPAEYVAQYAQYKIAQAIEAQKQQVERAKQLAEQQKVELEKTLTPEEQQANMQAFLQGLDDEAAKRAAKDAGLTEEDLANMDFMDDSDQKIINYKLFKEWHRNQLMSELQQRAAVENTVREKQAAIYKDINNFIAEAKASEPNFDEIDKIMNTRFQTMPYEQGKKIEAVYEALKAGNITEAQTVELRKYYEDVRKEFYAKKAGLSTTPKPAVRPPVVERAGNGKEVSNEYMPDYKALRNADPRAKRDWLADFLRNKGR